MFAPVSMRTQLPGNWARYFQSLAQQRRDDHENAMNTETPPERARRSTKLAKLWKMPVWGRMADPSARNFQSPGYHARRKAGV
jgi:hypothetical protein